MSYRRWPAEFSPEITNQKHDRAREAGYRRDPSAISAAPKGALDILAYETAGFRPGLYSAARSASALMITFQ